MISKSDVKKLSTLRTGGSAVLSLYLSVPMDPAQLRGLPPRAAELMAQPQAAVAQLSAGDRDAVLTRIGRLGRDWLGHTVAIFACGDIGLLEMYRLPSNITERAVLGIRPHVRPLLAAAQLWPPYRVAVVDRRHSWVFAVTGDEISTVAAHTDPTMPSSDFGGWYGLEAYRVHERVIQLARHHYRDTAAILAQVIRDGEPEPLVIGGHHDGVRQLLRYLPPAVHEEFAGSFAADTHQLTPARVRELAEPLVARWARNRAEQLATQIPQLPPARTAIGLADCLAAVNARAVEVLVVPDTEVIPGYLCGRCDTLCSEADGCPDWGTASQPVPDLVEEMITRTLDDGGQVSVAPPRAPGAATPTPGTPPPAGPGTAPAGPGTATPAPGAAAGDRLCAKLRYPMLPSSR